MSESIELTRPALTGPGDDEVRAAQAVLDAREEALARQARDSLLTCTSQIATGKGCGARHRVGDLVYEQTHWYEDAHGCTGGDRWHQGEGRWECPTCGHVNRLHASPEVVELKRHFLRVEESHAR